MSRIGELPNSGKLTLMENSALELMGPLQSVVHS